MRHKTTAQSLVEMAFILPILLVVLFGIIDWGYMIFAYATVGQSARNGAEQAAQLPPYEEWLSYQKTPPANPGYRFVNDDCTSTIFKGIESDAVLFRGTLNAGRNISDVAYVSIGYPTDTTPNTFDDQRRNLDVRGPIEITIEYPVRPLTPIFRMIRLTNNQGDMVFRATARRSIENLGASPNTGTSSTACSRNMAEWAASNK
jgi:Flp pilus assembly protein TadG